LSAHMMVFAAEDKGEGKAEMALKNRHAAPSQAQINAQVTLDAMLSKNTPDAWPKDSAARIEGTVVQVESEADGDTHIVLAPAGNETDTKHWVITEVTRSTAAHDPTLAPAALKA